MGKWEAIGVALVAGILAGCGTEGGDDGGGSPPAGINIDQRVVGFWRTAGKEMVLCDEMMAGTVELKTANIYKVDEYRSDGGICDPVSGGCSNDSGSVIGENGISLSTYWTVQSDSLYTVHYWGDSGELIYWNGGNKLDIQGDSLSLQEMAEDGSIESSLDYVRIDATLAAEIAEAYRSCLNGCHCDQDFRDL